MNPIFIWYWLIITTSASAGRGLTAESFAGKEWTPVSRGYDSNADGLITGAENMISPCELDDNYFFTQDGFARWFDNALRCGGPDEIVTRWKEGPPGMQSSGNLNAVFEETGPGILRLTFRAGNSHEPHYLLILKK